MPSPIGHALAGIAAGWLLQAPASAKASARQAPAAKAPAGQGQGFTGAPERSTPRLLRPNRLTLAFALLAIAPDLDLLLATHRGPTHSIGAVLAVGVMVWVIATRHEAAGTRLAIACAGAYGSHVLLDWLGSDSRPPIGVPALWPLSAAYYQSPWAVFLAVSRGFDNAGVFWRTNLMALALELLILAPLLVIVGWRKRKALVIR